MARKTVKKSQVEEAKTEAIIEAIPTEKVNTDLLVPEPSFFEDKKKDAAEVKEEVKPVKAVKKAANDKPVKKNAAVKKTKAEEKKSAPKSKSADKKPEAKSAVPVELQFRNGNYTSEQIAEMCRAAYKNRGGKQIRTLEVYVNASESRAFYVVNGKNADKDGNVYSIDL